MLWAERAPLGGVRDVVLDQRRRAREGLAAGSGRLVRQHRRDLARSASAATPARRGVAAADRRTGSRGDAASREQAHGGDHQGDPARRRARAISPAAAAIGPTCRSRVPAYGGGGTSADGPVDVDGRRPVPARAITGRRDLVRRRVRLAVHRARGHVEEVAGTGLDGLRAAGPELEPHPAVHHVQARLVRAVMVPPGGGARLGVHDARPTAPAPRRRPAAASPGSGRRPSAPRRAPRAPAVLTRHAPFLARSRNQGDTRCRRCPLRRGGGGDQQHQRPRAHARRCRRAHAARPRPATPRR